MRVVDVCFWTLCAFNLLVCAYVETHRAQVAFHLIGGDALAADIASHIHIEFGKVIPDTVDDRKIHALPSHPGRT